MMSDFREDLQTKIYVNGTFLKWFIFGCAILGLIIGHIHNAILFSIVQEQKISTLFHNETITKKEVEMENRLINAQTREDELKEQIQSLQEEIRQHKQQADSEKEYDWWGV